MARTNNASAGQLKALIERIEQRNEEKKQIAEDISDIYREAKSSGFDAKALREVVRRRAADPDALTELEALVATYEASLDGQGTLSFEATDPDDSLELEYRVSGETAGRGAPGVLD